MKSHKIPIDIIKRFKIKPIDITDQISTKISGALPTLPNLNNYLIPLHHIISGQHHLSYERGKGLYSFRLVFI